MVVARRTKAKQRNNAHLRGRTTLSSKQTFKNRVNNDKVLKPKKGEPITDPKKKEEVLNQTQRKMEMLLKPGKKVNGTKLWLTTKFMAPKPFHLPKKPLYPRKSISKPKALHKYQVLRFPVTTEKCIKMIEETNTITFITDVRATKVQIKKAFNELYGVKPVKVRTLIKNSTGEKKAFIKIPKEKEAVEIASKIGIC